MFASEGNRGLGFEFTVPVDIHEQVQFLEVNLHGCEGSAIGFGQLVGDLLQRPVAFPVRLIVSEDPIGEAGLLDEFGCQGDKGLTGHGGECCECVRLVLTILLWGQVPAVPSAVHGTPATADHGGAVLRLFEEADLVRVLEVDLGMHGEVSAFVKPGEGFKTFVAERHGRVVDNDRSRRHIDGADALAVAVEHTDQGVVEDGRSGNGIAISLIVDVLILDCCAKVALEEMRHVQRAGFLQQ